MTTEELDKEIVDELLGIRESYEKRIKETEYKLNDYQKQLAKVNRLIEVYQEKASKPLR